jgi:hypothetical protein
MQKMLFNSNKAINLRILAIATLLLLTSNFSFAIQEYQNTKLQADYAVSPSPCCTTTCAVFNFDQTLVQFLPPFPSGCPGFVPNIESYISHTFLDYTVPPSTTPFVYSDIRNIITFGIDHSLDTIFAPDFQISVNLQILAYSGGMPTMLYKTLSLNVNPSGGQNTSKDKDMIVLNGYDDVRVSILDIKDGANVAWPTTLPKVIIFLISE